ncbi:MAG: sensor histidine kinase KdpD [Chitinophagaceae bacterium]|nr:sensor histidine kinase KdpD [Anaerolineae bacterium]
MDYQRPNPDELLARVQKQEEENQRGRLKIFFGAAAGVGKTYAMLDAAQARRAEGVDVVVGYVEPHRRPETEAMLEGLEVIPSRIVEYRGTQLREFDLNAALIRRPILILVDELAHTNADGSRHPKRWQDVEELLAAGIDVYTTVNVQHLESLNDVIAQITGTIVKETIPDSILEKADEVELIDISPDDLLKRLQEGKIYLPQQAQQAMKSFFRKGNLMALRELSLRRTAERVDDQMQVYRQDKAVGQVWPAGERLLVCISPSPLSARLVRATKRMATGFHAEWMTVYVETPHKTRLSEANRNRVIQTLRLAEQLGSETATLTGENVTEEVLNYARKQNVTKIVIGKPVHSRWRDFIFGSVLDTLVRQSGAIDIYVISGEIDAPPPTIDQVLQNPIHWALYMQALLIVAACTLLAGAMFAYFAPATLIMVYLLGNVVVANRYGRGPSIVTSLMSVVAFDFFFVPPYLTFAVSDTQYLFTFIVMLLVGLTISGMTVRIKGQAEAAREREHRTSSLYSMSREFANTNSVDLIIQVAINHIEDVFESHIIIMLPDASGQLKVHGLEKTPDKFTVQEEGVARWAFDRGQAAGWGTQTLPGSNGLYLPLLTSKGKAGVLGIYPVSALHALSPDHLHLLETFANQTALAIERARLTEETEKAQVQIETERMRNSLLSSVSHDLRTPLAAITGATSGLLQHRQSLDVHSLELVQIAYEEAERLNRLVGNLLEMTRLESGSVHVDKEWQPFEEVIGTTLGRMDAMLADHRLTTHLPDDLPLVSIDGVLIEQVLVNLLENAIKYTPIGSPIDLSAWAEGYEVIVEIADRGAGVPTGEEERIFDKFYRVRPTTSGGVGLGLTICKAIIEAHGGRIWASNRIGGGAVFRFTLPLNGEPPQVDVEDEQAR